MSELEKRTTIGITVSANETLKRLKDEYGKGLSMPEFFSILIGRVEEKEIQIFKGEKEQSNPAVPGAATEEANAINEPEKKEEQEDPEKHFHPEPAWYQGDICRDVSMLRKRLRENRNDLKEFLAWYGDMHTEEEVREFCYILVGRRDP